MADAFSSTWRAESQRLDLGSCIIEVVTTKSLSKHRFS
ncbi:MAG: hypothetical protein JWO28_1856 [Hyphomicrobiales bacterium]|nr:hypothetical protein [Hyphomicrobiales bacterium]